MNDVILYLQIGTLIKLSFCHVVSAHPKFDHFSQKNGFPFLRKKQLYGKRMIPSKVISEKRSLHSLPLIDKLLLHEK